jgi:hypothetical protein
MLVVVGVRQRFDNERRLAKPTEIKNCLLVAANNAESPPGGWLAVGEAGVSIHPCMRIVDNPRYVRRSE